MRGYNENEKPLASLVQLAHLVVDDKLLLDPLWVVVEKELVFATVDGEVDRVYQVALDESLLRAQVEHENIGHTVLRVLDLVVEVRCGC